MSNETDNKGTPPPPPPRPADSALDAPQAPTSPPAANPNPAPVAPQAPNTMPPSQTPPLAPQKGTPSFEASSGAIMPSPTAPADLTSPSSALSSVEDEFFAGDNPNPSVERPKVSGPDVTFSGGSSLASDAPPKTRGKAVKFLLLLILLVVGAAAAYFLLFSDNDAPKNRPIHSMPSDNTIEDSELPALEPIGGMTSEPEESVYTQQCREHFNSGITARGEDPAMYGEQADAYIASCAVSLEAQASGGAQ